MLSVQTNMLAENASRQFKVNTKKTAKNAEKLSSGYRINRAADDAAGLAISEKMRRQVRGLHQTVDNISEGVGYVQTAEGALNEVQDILQRINELAVKAANGTNTVEDRAAIDSEIQHLKNEMNRIFSTTTFNERKIWEPQDWRLLDIVPKQAVEFNNTSTEIPVTNDNCGVIAYGRYNIIAKEDEGVHIEWTGYDGESYETIPITWEKLKENNYSFEMSDYFGEVTPDNKLYDANGEKVFMHRVSFEPQETATLDDIIDCINGTWFSGGVDADMDARFEDNQGNEITRLQNSNLPLIRDVELLYSAAYASNHNTGNDASTSDNVHDFDKADDDFLAPTDQSGDLVQDKISGGNLINVPSNGTSDVNIARESGEQWVFNFYMDGIGEVKAVSKDIRYAALSDTEDDDYGLDKWWIWEGRWENNNVWNPEYRKVMRVRSVNEKGEGTLGSLMQTLTGKKGSSSPGLLNSNEDGDADGGGYIDIEFTLTAKNQYTYGNGQTSNAVGSFVLRFTVSNTDKEQDVLNRINGALNSNTILDFYTPSGNSITYGSASFKTASANIHTIDVPIYGGICSFYVQAGTEGGQHIEVKYEALSTIALGMEDTNVLTVESAQSAINEVKGALQIVSEQRSTFGAYQNRLEHAQNINENVEENTQAAESLIRDTDIADAMMEFSINNILMQAGTSMLTQANQSSQLILGLLQ